MRLGFRVLPSVVLSLSLLLSGCGGGAEKDAGKALPTAEDPTLNPAKDSTLAPTKSNDPAIPQ